MPDPLSVLERRALGVLVEKALTSAAPEPLTLNAIVTGCNQKSNRDPVLSLEEPEVDSCLEGLQRKGLVFRVTGSRVERWRHNLYDAWKVSKPELALLAELLLRGAQTAAEARSRASRMEPLDQDSASTGIRALVERGYIVWLEPESRRGAQLTHGFHSAEELARLNSGQTSSIAHVESAAPATTQPNQGSLLSETIAEVAKLRSEVDQLRAQLTHVQQSLGITPNP
jgi:uncharacterized protein YceH (UPF0502 family)